MLLTCELSIPVADLEGGLECVSVWSGVTLDLGFEDNCTSTGGAFTGGRRGRRKNLILVILSKSEAGFLVILSKSEASCSSASKTSDSSSLSSVIRSAIFLSRSHKIFFFHCSCSRVFISKTASSSLKGVVGSPSSISATLLRVLERCALYPLQEERRRLSSSIVAG